MPTDRPTFEALKDFLAETSPILVKARDGLHEEGKMLVEVDDRIYVIEGRTDSTVWKGQNQRTFEISFFPRRIVEDLSGRRNPDISRPLKNSLIHTGHGSHAGKTWGNPEYIDEVYLRNPMNPGDAPGSSPEGGGLGGRLQTRNSMRGAPPEQSKERGQRRAPTRPAPVPGQVKPPSVKSMPNLKAEAGQHVKEDSLIDLSNDDRFYYNTGGQKASSSNLLDNSLSEQLSVNESWADRSYQNEQFEAEPPQAEADCLSTSRHSQYINQLEVGSSDHQHQDSHNTSFGSLAPGETYHYPPEDDDPFDTSTVEIPNLNSTPRSEVNLESSLSQMRISGGGPSIISQLLASQPSSQSSSPQPGLTPPPTRRVTASEPRHLQPGPDPRHRRAVSTMSEAETFLPPLTSPFSPPAFNPYDIVLGSNEAIAGLESPAPFGKSRRDLAFSWLDDKMGNLKGAKSSQNLTEQSAGGGEVFQFPAVNHNDDDLRRQQEITRQQEIESLQEMERKLEMERQQEMERELEIERQKEIVRQQEILRQQELERQKEMERQHEENRKKEVQRQQELVKQQELYQQQQELARQQLLRQQEEIQKQEQLEMARQMEMARQQLEIQQKKELERQQMEAERQRDLLQRQERIRQQELLARQQRENELAKQNMQILMQKQMMQQAENEQRLKFEQQQQVVYSQQQKEQEMQQKNLQKIMNFKKTPGLVPGVGSPQDVFQFPQSSSLPTSGHEEPPFSVDQDFIKDLEKSLGANEAVANMLGPQPPPTPSMKVSNIPSLQPPPANPASRTSPGHGGARPRSSPRQEVTARPSSRSSGGRPGSRASSRQESEGEVRTAHVKPFKHQETGGAGKMGDVLGATSGWRSLNMPRGPGRVDLLAGQRSQLDRYTTSPEQSEQTYGTARPATSNAVEINKIAQCSKMVPGMSGTEIRAALEAVNWDASVAVKNLKIDKLFRIGVATKPKCEKVLQAVSWDLERAASKLLDSL